MFLSPENMKKKIMQFFSADATVFFLPLKTWKNHPQKLLIIGPDPFFQYCHSAHIQPKSPTAGLPYNDFECKEQ